MSKKHWPDYDYGPESNYALCDEDVWEPGWAACAEDEITCDVCKGMIAKEREEADELRKRRREMREAKRAGTPVDANGRYLIECREHQRSGAIHRLWWAEKSRGYTTDLDKAGRYSREEALSTVRGISDRDEVVWAESDVLNGKGGRIQRAVVWEG